MFDSEDDGYGERYSVANIDVVCPHCGSDRFEFGSAQLNTSGLTFLGLDWANRNAHILTCTTCGNVQWFVKSPQVVYD